MMRSEHLGDYQGQATLIDHQGVEHTIRVNLISSIERHYEHDKVLDGLTSWSGTAQSDAPWSNLQGHALTLRIGDREGICYVHGFDIASGTWPVEISGSSPPPFGPDPHRDA
jgi:hypothetical protein